MPENKKSRKPRKIKAFGVVCGVPARIRTGGVPLRRRTLYPAEVQRHLAICGYFYSTHLPPFCERREVEQTLRRRSLYPAELRKHIAIVWFLKKDSYNLQTANLQAANLRTAIIKIKATVSRKRETVFYVKIKYEAGKRCRFKPSSPSIRNQTG